MIQTISIQGVSLFLLSTSSVSPSQAARISGAHPGEESTPQGRSCPQTEQSTLSEPGKEGVEEIGSFLHKLAG